MGISFAPDQSGESCCVQLRCAARFARSNAPGCTPMPRSMANLMAGVLRLELSCFGRAALFHRNAAPFHALYCSAVEQLGMNGVLVLNARDGGPAAKAGIRGSTRDEYGR